MGLFDMETIRYKYANARSHNQTHYVDNLLKSILDLLYPRFCQACGALGHDLCPTCLTKADTRAIDFPLCFVCENLCLNGKTHEICKRNCPISQYVFTYAYHGIPKRVIQLKRKSPHILKILLTRPSNLRALIRLYPVDLIIPIPPSPSHFSPRISEPVDIISKYICQYIKTPVYKALYKNPTATQQKLLGVTQRQNPSIRIKREAIYRIRNKKVLLVDDLCTSGSTLNFSANLLRQFGAKDVTAYTLARDLKY